MVAVRVIQISLLAALCGFVLGLAPRADGAPGDLSVAKIALHLAPGFAGPNACQLAPPSGCSDGSNYEPGFAVVGGVGEDYVLYVMATDINTSIGLSEVSFTIAYSEDVHVSGWRSCADSSSPSANWPASGSDITVSFSACAGTQPGEADPEGDGDVLLGVMHVYASDEGRLAIGALDESSRSAQLTNCAGEATTLGWTMSGGFLGLVALGEVAFGKSANGACLFPGIVDDLCALGLSNDMYTCCQPEGGCAGGLANVSPRACAYAGGAWTLVRCNPYGCVDEYCLGVPVRATTWGTIKARY